MPRLRLALALVVALVIAPCVPYVAPCLAAQAEVLVRPQSTALPAQENAAPQSNTPQSNTLQSNTLQPNTQLRNTQQQNAPQPPAPLPRDPLQPLVVTPQTSTTMPTAPGVSQDFAPDVPPIASPSAGSAAGALSAGPATTPPQSTASAAPLREFNERQLLPRFHGLLGPFMGPVAPPLLAGDASRMNSLIRDGKLYLTLNDALALAIENNLDVELERYDLTLADTDLVRAKGGGSLRGIDYGVQLLPNGVGGPGSPLLNTATNAANPAQPSLTDLTSLNSTAETTQSLSNLGTAQSYGSGPNLPLFDPQLIAELGYLRRSDTVTLTTTDGTTGTTGTGTTASGNETQPLDFTEMNVAYLEGFSTGAQLEATVNNDSQVIYGAQSRLDPFYTPSTSVTLTQPLLRGFGRNLNLRFVHIAQLDRKVSRLLFEQQVLNVVYGTSRLYFDLVSLGENVLVKQEALKAATKLRDDDREQEQIGTLAPIDLTRAESMRSASEFDLIQAQGLYRQQEIILKTQLLRTASPLFAAQIDEIVPTDRILIPQQFEAHDVDALIAQGLAQRPDLAQSELQIKAGQIAAAGSRNGAHAQLNVYANVETRGSTEQAYDALGSTGTGLPTNPQNLALGGLRTSTIVQAGVQLTLPLRNRVAESDAARDAIQLRQVQARNERLEEQAREEIETAVVALQTAEAGYRAAVNSRDYQQQLLDAERDKLSVGQSTELLVLQNEAYLAQAMSTEIAARSNWKKAQIELDRELGDLLQKNGISLDDAIQGTLR
jgi:outer membrane protein